MCAYLLVNSKNVKKLLSCIKTNSSNLTIYFLAYSFSFLKSSYYKVSLYPPLFIKLLKPTNCSWSGPPLPVSCWSRSCVSLDCRLSQLVCTATLCTWCTLSLLDSASIFEIIPGYRSRSGHEGCRVFGHHDPRDRVDSWRWQLIRIVSLSWWFCQQVAWNDGDSMVTETWGGRSLGLQTAWGQGLSNPTHSTEGKLIYS
jgi:hypothetical protein